MDAEYKLKSLKVEFVRGWKHEGTVDHYEGEITFASGDKESFTFRIDPSESAQYLEIIAKKVVETATKLGADLAKSLQVCHNLGIIASETPQPKGFQ